MLFILFNWIYIFFSSLSFGFIIKKFLRIQNNSFIVHHVLGLFLISIVGWFYSFFFGLDIGYYLVFFIVTILGLVVFRNDVRIQFLQIKNVWVAFRKVYKIGFFFVFIAALAMSATVPSIFDNESYYIQTIKWLNEYGLVKGLGNLHVFFAQTSSWHVVQAQFSFPFLEINFNDLNGYFLVLFSGFCLYKLQGFQETNKYYDLYIGSTLVSLPFLMFFLNAPSPDLPVFLLAQLLFFLFIKNYKETTISNFTIILLIAIFLCVIKITTCVLLVLPFILFVKHGNLLRSSLLRLLIVAVFVFLFFLAKNVILTGYLLYPLEILDVLKVDWKVPAEIIALFKVGTYSAAFDYQKLEDLSTVQLFISWLTSFKFNGIINTIFILLLLVFPLLWYFKSREKSIFIIYCLGAFHFILAWIFSPQYRFFFFFMLFFLLQILVWFFKKEKTILGFVYLGFICSFVPFLTEIKLSNYTTIKKIHTQTTILQFENSIIPNANSSMSLVFEEQSVNGFKFISPPKESYFWSTGNGTLPCVNKKQVQFIKLNYQLVPSLRTTNLKDGFKSVRIQ